MIDTIIFDIGQVLAHFRWKEYMQELGFSEETIDKLAKATVLSKWWVENDRGMAKEEYQAGMKADHPELAKEMELFFADTEQIVEPFDYSEKLVCELKKQGYRVYILSNYGEFLYHQACPKFTFRKHIDGELISFQVHQLKPNAEIYHTLFERFQIQPEHAVFLDDLAANIEGAKRVGLNGIQFQNLEQALDELKGYGVEIDGNLFR